MSGDWVIWSWCNGYLHVMIGWLRPKCLGFTHGFGPSHSQEWSMSNFPCSLTRIITSNSMKNLAFHSSLRWKMIIQPILTTSLIPFLFKRLGECTFWTWVWQWLYPQDYHISGGENEQFWALPADSFNPFTPKSDQVQISPVASTVILHHTVWRTWLFIAYSDWKMILVPVLTT